MNHLEKFGDRYPSFEAGLARISDLSRVIEARPDNYENYKKRFKLFAKLGLMRHSIVGGRRFLELASKEALSGAENSKEDADDLEVLRRFTETTAQHMLRRVQADVLKEAQDADALVQRAWAHYALGDLDLALADLDLVLVYDPSRLDVKDRRDQVAKVRAVLARNGLLKPSHLTQP